LFSSSRLDPSRWVSGFKAIDRWLLVIGHWLFDGQVTMDCVEQALLVFPMINDQRPITNDPFRVHSNAPTRLK
jgi:hypothetical protein